MLVPLDPATGQRKKNLTKDEQKEAADAVRRDVAGKAASARKKAEKK
jgi:hypothetical protein